MSSRERKLPNSAPCRRSRWHAEKAWARNLISGGALVGCAAASWLAPATSQAQGAPPTQVGAVPPASPVGGMNIDLGTLLRAKPGAWADYTMTAKGTDKPVTIRYALVERAPTTLALEVDTALPKGEMVIHFELAQQAADTWKLAAGKVQLGDQKMDLTAAELAAAPPFKTSDPPGELVGGETVTTPLGVLACKHYRKSVLAGGKGPWSDLWINESVSPTGLVKSTFDSMGVQSTLVATGTGAQSKLH